MKIFHSLAYEDGTNSEFRNVSKFWVIPRRLSSNCRRFGTHYRSHLHRQVNEVFHSPAYEDGTDIVFRNVGKFWVIPRRLNSNCRRFGTHYRFHLHWQVNEVFHLPMKMEPIMSSETSAIRTQTPGNYPKRNNLHLDL